jgi:hypothetical protein
MNFTTRGPNGGKGRASRLVFEQLEDRLVLAHLTYHGGPLLSHVAIKPIFLGSAWQDQAAPKDPSTALAKHVGTDHSLVGVAGAITTFLGNIADSQYMDDLSQYVDGPRGTVAQVAGLAGPVPLEDFVPATLTDVVTKQDVESYILREIHASPAMQAAGPAAPNDLYFVFLPPGVELDKGSAFGFHYTIEDGASPRYYAVVAYPGRVDHPDGTTTQNPKDASSKFDTITITASHELVEAVTNPSSEGGGNLKGDLGQKGESSKGKDPNSLREAFEEFVGFKGGWYDESHVSFRGSLEKATTLGGRLVVPAKVDITAENQGEVADLADTGLKADDFGETSDDYGPFDGYEVSYYFENTYDPGFEQFDGTYGHSSGIQHDVVALPSDFVAFSLTGQPTNANFEVTNVFAPSTALFSGLVGTFADNRGILAGQTDPARYTTDIRWGDGQTSVGRITFNPETLQFEVRGDHYYSDAPGSREVVALTVTDVRGGSTQLLRAVTLTDRNRPSAALLPDGPEGSLTSLYVGGTAPGGDVITLRRGAAGGVEVIDGTFDQVFADPTGRVVVETYGGGNAVVFDFSRGNFLPAAGTQISGAGLNNVFTAEGGSFNAVDASFGGAAAGRLVYDGREVAYSGIKSVRELSTAASLIVNADAGTRTIDVLDGPKVDGVQTLRVAGDDPAFTPLDIADKSTLIIFGACSDLVFAVDTTLGAAGLTNLVLNGGSAAGDDPGDVFRVVATPPTLATSVIGGSGQDTLDVSALTGQDVLLRGLGSGDGLRGRDAASSVTFDNIERILGDGATSRLTGDAAASTWSLTGDPSQFRDVASGRTLDFAGFRDLAGGSVEDRFVFLAGGSVAGKVTGGGKGTLDFSNLTGPVVVNQGTGTASRIGGGFSAISSFIGSAGSDTLVGPATAATWSIAGPNSGSVNGWSFSSFENLLGGDAGDRFAFLPGGHVDGGIDGGAGGNTFDYSALTTPVTINLQAGTATAIGGTFSHITNFVGGSGANAVVGPDSPTSWSITAADAVGVGGYGFAGFQSVTGGSSRDVFAFQPGGRLTGKLDGGGGINALDYAAFPGDITVNLALGTATGVGQGLARIQDVSGGLGNALIVGDAQPNVLVGGRGRNIIIGGAAADRVVGGSRDNILIGGTTAYDLNANALGAIMAEWTRADLAFEKRVEHLMTGNNGALNGPFTLSKETMFDDLARDVLTGGGSLDWYFVNQFDDTVNNRKPKDHITLVK